MKLFTFLKSRHCNVTVFACCISFGAALLTSFGLNLGKIVHVHESMLFYKKYFSGTMSMSGGVSENGISD